MAKKKHKVMCGLCNTQVEDWAIHVAGTLHRRNLERASKGEMGIAAAGVANKQLADEAMDRMDASFNELKKHLEEEKKDGTM